MSTHLRAARDIATAVAIEAGRLQLERRHQVFSVETKAHPNDFATAVDLESEQLIVGRLVAAFPDDAVFAEEGARHEGTTDYRWVIDPLDGTRSYLSGVGPFSVCIALQQAGETVVGVVHDPVSDETFSAIADNGAVLNGSSIRVSDRDSFETALLGISFNPSTSGKARVANFLHESLGSFGDFRRLSAGLDFCYVAAGRLDGCIHVELQEWDVAAGALIAREAGAWLGGLDGAPTPDCTLTCTPAMREPFVASTRDQLDV